MALVVPGAAVMSLDEEGHSGSLMTITPTHLPKPPGLAQAGEMPKVVEQPVEMGLPQQGVGSGSKRSREEKQGLEQVTKHEV